MHSASGSGAILPNTCQRSVTLNIITSDFHISRCIVNKIDIIEAKYVQQRVNNTNNNMVHVYFLSDWESCVVHSR